MATVTPQSQVVGNGLKQKPEKMNLQLGIRNPTAASPLQRGVLRSENKSLFSLEGL